ncbi:hypothetical protein [Salegentibacter sp. Hel_I_6]|uniref:hypothetical protein n=1 Tax=Salegentibacter sp. Hel_I_6 TaxID=1250278 RepID=UPI00055E0116|nr:hypothetical protein [Salegentibacter sp. Hel_I_6]
MKNILIPTDFTVDSLELLKIAIQNEPEERIRVTLVYGASLSNSICDLLFFSKSACLDKLREPNFCEALSIIQNKYSKKIHRIDTELFMSHSTAAFHNFLEGNAIDKVYVPLRDDILKVDKSKGFNLVPYLKKSNLETQEIDYRQAANINEGQQLSRLLIR